MIERDFCSQELEEASLDTLSETHQTEIFFANLESSLHVTVLTVELFPHTFTYIYSPHFIVS